MNEALEGLFTKLGYDRKNIWRISVIFWVLFTASCILAVYLSSWGKGAFITLGLYLYMMFVVLPILFSPVLWLIGGALLSFIGQFGGVRGLSLKDAIAAMKKYGTPVLSKAGYALLLALPIWFIAMRLINTKGIEEWFLFGFPLLPLTIYLVVKRWPDGKTFEAVVRTLLLAIMLGILALGVYNTVERTVTDPAAQEVLTYLNQGVDAKKTAKKLVAEVIIGKLKAKEALTVDEQRLWNILTKEAQAQSLVTKTEQFVENAKPADSSWWKAHWVTVGGITLALVVGYLWFGRTKMATAGATPAAAPALAGRTKSRLGWIIALAVIAWCGYSINQGVGWLGTWWKENFYQHTKTVAIADLQPQLICGLPANRSLKFSSPLQDYLYYDGRGKDRARSGFFIRDPRTGHVLGMAVQSARINDTMPGEEFWTDTKGCVTMTWQSAIPTAVVLGSPIYRLADDKYVGPAENNSPLPFQWEVRFEKY